MSVPSLLVQAAHPDFAVVHPSAYQLLALKPQMTPLRPPAVNILFAAYLLGLHLQSSTGPVGELQCLGLAAVAFG